MILDEIDAYRRFDRSGMLVEIRNTPRRLRVPKDASMTLPDLVKPEKVVIGGMGGSAIAGDVVADYMRTESEIPITVCRTLHVPRFVNERTLFVAISYSGETRETISLLKQAEARRAMIVSICSGGALLSNSLVKRTPHIQVRQGLPPRVALPELLASLLLVLEKSSILKNIDGLLESLSKALETQIERIEQTKPFDENQAKHFAVKLLNRVPLLIGPEEMVSVLRRFKNELNENSKMPAFWFSYPECYHDDVEGLKMLREVCAAQLIFLMTTEHGSQIRTREILFKLVNDLDFPPILKFGGIGENFLSELLTAITFGDYVSIYLAILRGEDPTRLTQIPQFRATASAS
jgi:glucose/mannose-6-phosphate isomerase